MKRVLISAALVLCAGMALAQGYPNKPIKIVVPFTPGSATDIMARIVGEKLSAAWGQPVVIDNKPGAGGTVGAGSVISKDAPDGALSVARGRQVNIANWKRPAKKPKS